MTTPLLKLEALLERLDAVLSDFDATPIYLEPRAHYDSAAVGVDVSGERIVYSERWVLAACTYQMNGDVDRAVDWFNQYFEPLTHLPNGPIFLVSGTLAAVATPSAAGRES